jgi:hypothetical protein
MSAQQLQLVVQLTPINCQGVPMLRLQCTDLDKTRGVHGNVIRSTRGEKLLGPVWFAHARLDFLEAVYTND